MMDNYTADFTFDPEQHGPTGESTMQPMSPTDSSNYLWKPQPAAARFVAEQVSHAVEASRWIDTFQQRLLSETGTRLVDWLDHIVVPAAPEPSSLGFEPDSQGNVLENHAGLFPRILLDESTTHPILGIKVESMDDFLQAHSFDGVPQVLGPVQGDFRLAVIALRDGSQLRVVERHGYRGFDPNESQALPAEGDGLFASLCERSRAYDDPQSGFQDATRRYLAARSIVGPARAGDMFFHAERKYWQARNRAAQVQVERQNKLGLGWANHDHHTYRCSREWFAPLVKFLETLGFHCRERFYAGNDAGWGAQVLEHVDCGIVIFADVDMSEEEVTGDFAHEGLEAREELGTVGLWCKLHCESFLAAGMHHLECQFDFDAARAQLADVGIQSMAPFTDLPHLKQAFTQGERWLVDRERLLPLVARGAITRDDAERFATEGALGSHLEILERNDGYKGFNQSGISKIIHETDPRRESEIH
jgi:hypothetical protein